jgi:hypothetical protein
MMKNNITILISLLLLLTACEKEIKVDLKNAEKKYVVEAFITDSLGYNEVKITQSAGFYDDNVFPSISGATVNITDGANNYSFTEINPGIYKSNTIIAQQGVTYTIFINHPQFQTSAKSTVPTKIKIDSIAIEENLGFGNKTYRPRVYFKDQANQQNYYRFILYINNKKQNDIYAVSDLYFNGKQTSYPLFGSEIKPFDTVKVELYSIDKANYIYFNTLDEIANSSFSGTIPGNPESNFDNQNILGYFGAYSVSADSLIFK